MRAGPTGQLVSGQRALAGRYSYRFSGHATAYDRPWFLCGIGMLSISTENVITGSHVASILPMAGVNAALQRAEYKLSGNIEVNGDGAGTAEITFSKVSGSGEDVTGLFDVRMAGDSRNFWMVSAGAKLPTGEPADELVTVEATWAGA
jgi:hypothetical protein